MGPGALLRADVLFRDPAWAMLYQLPIACLAVHFGLMTQVEDRPAGVQLWKVIGAMGAGATVAFQLILWLVPGLLGLLLAAAGMYVLVMIAVDKLLRIHLEHAHAVTSWVCIAAWVPWLLVGAAVSILGAL